MKWQRLLRWETILGWWKEKKGPLKCRRFLREWRGMLQRNREKADHFRREKIRQRYLEPWKRMA